MKHSLVPVVIVIVIVIAFVIVIVIYLDLVWIEALTTSIDSTSSLWSQKEKTSAHVFVGDLNEIFLKLVLFLGYLQLDPSRCLLDILSYNSTSTRPGKSCAHHSHGPWRSLSTHGNQEAMAMECCFPECQ